MRDLQYISDMLEASEEAVAMAAGLTEEAFVADRKLQLAVTHLIQIIGEAASRTSAEFRDSHSEIPWSQITGMRNRLVHDYLNVDLETVWEVATQHLPPLISQLNSILPDDLQFTE